MVEKIGAVKNPLTIIAIFAGIAEISGTVVLPFIAPENQSIYIWFLMLFPILLVLFFFATLNFNHKVLYAPSDFSDEENFFRSVQRASVEEIDAKIQEEIVDLNLAQDMAPAPTQHIRPRVDAALLHRRYEHLSDAALIRLESELGQTIAKGIRLGGGSPSFVFDGAIISHDRVTAVEVKYFREVKSLANRVRETMPGIISTAESLPDSMRDRFSLILVIITDAPTPRVKELTKTVRASLGITPFTVDVRIMSAQSLEDEFGPP